MIDAEDDQNEAMAAAEPVLSVVYGILEDAVLFYFSDHYSNEARAEHDDRAMANCIYAHAEKRMVRAAESIEGLVAINVRGLRVLSYRDHALLRFKKVKPNGKHSNYQTKQQRDYDDQLTIPGLPEPAFRLTVGYETDASGSVLERIMIARPNGRDILWTAQVMMIDDTAVWEDITPRRFTGTDFSDFDSVKARGRRG